MSYIHVLSLHVRVVVYVAILANILHTTECLENRRSDQCLFASNSKDVDIYATGEQCTLETDDNAKQWIDPFEMLPSNNNKNKKTKMDGSVKREKQCEVYMQRFINLFLRRSGLTNYNLQYGSEKQVNFDFIISGKDLAILQKYGESGRSEDIFAVNDVLTRLFGSDEGTVFSQKPSSFENNINIPFSQGISSFSSKVYSSIVNSPEVSIPICVVAVSIAAFYIVYVTRSYKLAVFTIMYIVFAANFGITWYRMYQEEMSLRFYAEMKHSGAPPHCKGERLPWYEYLTSSLFGEDCEKYYKKHFTNPMSQVSLNAVFSESMSVLFLHPAQHIAKAYGDFITIATDSVPFLLKPFVFPIVCIIPILVLFTLLVFLFNYQFSISPFTGFRISPHGGQSRCSKEREDNKCIEKSADTAHSSKSQQITNQLESTVASNDSSPLMLLNWPAIEKFLHINQKGKDGAATKEHNNKVCTNCQIVMSVPCDGSGDSSQNVPSSGVKKKNGSCSQENSVCKQLKESETNIKQCVTCSGDCCIHEKASTLLSEDLNAVCGKAGEEGEKSVQQMETIENKHKGISSCHSQNNNEAISKESGSVSEKLKECI